MTRRGAYEWITGLGGALIRIGGGFLVIAMACAGTWLVVRIGGAVAYGIERWANGEPLDMANLGQLALLVTAVAGAIATVVPVIMGSNRDRRLREIETIRQGGAPPVNPTSPPSPPSAPADGGDMPGGGLVNPEAFR